MTKWRGALEFLQARAADPDQEGALADIAYGVTRLREVDPTIFRGRVDQLQDLQNRVQQAESTHDPVQVQNLMTAFSTFLNDEMKEASTQLDQATQQAATPDGAAAPPPAPPGTPPEEQHRPPGATAAPGPVPGQPGAVPATEAAPPAVPAAAAPGAPAQAPVAAPRPALAPHPAAAPGAAPPHPGLAPHPAAAPPHAAPAPPPHPAAQPGALPHPAPPHPATAAAAAAPPQHLAAAAPAPAAPAPAAAPAAAHVHVQVPMQAQPTMAHEGMPPQQGGAQGGGVPVKTSPVGVPGQDIAMESQATAEEAKPNAHAKPGEGGRFAAMKDKLGDEKGVDDPGALAASIGRQKYGAQGMASMAAHGKEGQPMNSNFLTGRQQAGAQDGFGRYDGTDIPTREAAAQMDNYGRYNDGEDAGDNDDAGAEPQSMEEGNIMPTTAGGQKATQCEACGHVNAEKPAAAGMQEAARTPAPPTPAAAPGAQAPAITPAEREELQTLRVKFREAELQQKAAKAIEEAGGQGLVEVAELTQFTESQWPALLSRWVTPTVTGNPLRDVPMAPGPQGRRPAPEKTVGQQFREAWTGGEQGFEQLIERPAPAPAATTPPPAEK